MTKQIIKGDIVKPNHKGEDRSILRRTIDHTKARARVISDVYGESGGLARGPFVDLFVFKAAGCYSYGKHCGIPLADIDAA